MITLEELEQLVTFAESGTLSKAAEQLHLSQPTVTRTMQRLEESFGVSLFVRGKNRIVLNKTGMQAVDHARRLLEEVNQMLDAVRAYDRSLRTILVESCAPAPLWTLVPALTQRYPDMTISASIAKTNTIPEHVKNGSIQIGLTLSPVEDDRLQSREYAREQLSVCLPKDHPLVQGGATQVSFDDLNGYNCLLRSSIGFWEDLCRIRMPASRFLIQTDDFTFQELAEHSSLPFFVTNLSQSKLKIHEKRRVVPIADTEASVTYWILTNRNSDNQI